MEMTRWHGGAIGGKAMNASDDDFTFFSTIVGAWTSLDSFLDDATGYTSVMVDS